MRLSRSVRTNRRARYSRLPGGDPDIDLTATGDAIELRRGCNGGIVTAGLLGTALTVAAVVSTIYFRSSLTTDTNLDSTAPPAATFMDKHQAENTQQTTTKQQINTKEEEKQKTTKPDRTLPSDFKCKTKLCKHLTGVMDLTQDPCQDFYEYACGNWGQVHKNPGKDHWTNFVRLDTLNSEIIRKGLEGKGKYHHDSTVDKMMRKFYKLCRQRNVVSLEDSRHDLKSAFANLSLEIREATAKRDLTDLLVTMSNQYGVQPFFTWSIGVNDKNSSKHIIKLDQPSLILGSKYYLEDEEKENNLKLFEEYIKTLFSLYEDNGNLWEKQESTLLIQGIMEIETEISLIQLDPEEHRNSVFSPVYSDVSHVTDILTFIDWGRYINSTIRGDKGEMVPGHHKLILLSNSFLSNVSRIIEPRIKTPEGRRQVAVYCFLHLLHSLVDNLCLEFREAREVLLSSLGKRIKKNLKKTSWKTCLKETSDVFKYGLGNIYIEETDNEDSGVVEGVVEMLGRIKTSLVENFNQNPWMDEETRKNAVKKSEKIVGLLGYPETAVNQKKLLKKYKSVDVSGSSYMTIRLRMTRQSQSPAAAWSRLTRSVASTSWVTSPQKINAFYAPVMNQILIPIGIMQPPFFSLKRNKALNYGGIGFTIGHELSHAFDENGRKYDGAGNLANWWGQKAVEGFEKHTACLVDQFNSYQLYGQPVNGRSTLPETIADNGGVAAAWRAFSSLPSADTAGDPVPGLPFTPQQLFFLGFSQVWCSNNSFSYEVKKIKNDPHPPSKYRVISAVSNSPDFGPAWNCPLGSPMNPVSKCSVW